MQQNLVNAAYLVASVLFILGLKGLTSPRTALRGNLLGATGMLIAVTATLLVRQIVSFELILVGIAIGSVVGVAAALKVPLTAMPELVALFNGFGGGASALVAAAAVLSPAMIGDVARIQMYTAGAASAIIGAATLTGSVIAWAKLQGMLSMQPRGGVLHTINFACIAGALGLGIYYALDPGALWAFWTLISVAALYGVLFTVPVGGADMPVVITLLNSYAGLAASATGFALDNNVLIIAGAIDGASGFILSVVMSKAMNRSFRNVLFGAFGKVDEEDAAMAAAGGERVQEASVGDAAMLLSGAGSVIVCPGYGMAVAQAQHVVGELAEILEANGTQVRYAIHPVAGRMPGHMNVLLAEAKIPYTSLMELEEINEDFKNTDVALVVGANDVVNPAAKHNPASSIYGMPVLNADLARSCIVLKRSMRPGFAGIENELFFAPNTVLTFGDAKDTLTKVVEALS